MADAGEVACRAQRLHALNIVAGEHVLELRFDNGHALVALADFVGSNGMVCGVDISAGVLGVARKTVQAAGVGDIALTIGDARSLNCRDALFDAAFMSSTLELFDSRAILAVLAEVRRVLRPTGRLGVVAISETPDQNVMTDIYTGRHRHLPRFVDCRPIDVADLLGQAALRVRSGAPSRSGAYPVFLASV